MMIVDAIVTSIMSVVCFLLAWIYCRRNDEAAQLKDEVEELRERVKDADEALTGLKEALDHTEVLLRKATDRADRLAAMNQGLAEDLAALKKYDPEEVDERLRKIRELRAEEERKITLERLQQAVQFSVAMSMLTGGYGSQASACCSLEDQQRISWR